MPKYNVKIREINHYTVTVDAVNESEADEKAVQEYSQDVGREPGNTEIEVTSITLAE